MGRAAATTTVNQILSSSFVDISPDGTTTVTPIVEGPPGDATCSDGVDNDGDGNTDSADNGCQPTGPPPALCEGLPATIVGTPGNDIINGTNGNDVIAGLGGNDIVNGGAGNDVICGDAGNDILTDGNDNDVLLGGEGNDVLMVKTAGGPAGWTEGPAMTPLSARTATGWTR